MKITVGEALLNSCTYAGGLIGVLGGSFISALAVVLCSSGTPIDRKRSTITTIFFYQAMLTTGTSLAGAIAGHLEGRSVLARFPEWRETELPAFVPTNFPYAGVTLFTGAAIALGTSAICISITKPKTM